MRLDHVRGQHPVGQGFFHTGVVTSDSQMLTYVVDCGSMAAYAEARNREVDGVLAQWGRTGRPVDFLFISHAHADHINGLPRLLGPASGLNVDTIVLPLLSEEERLIAFAQTSDQDPIAARNDFFQDFIVDPVAALGRFGPGRIILAEGNPDDGGAPFSGQPGSDGDRPSGTDLLTRDGQSWKPVGRGNARPHERSPLARSANEHATDRLNDVQAVVMPDTLGFVVRFDDDIHWLLATYVDPSVTSQREKFLRTLAVRLRMNVSALKHAIQDSRFLRDLLINHESELRKAYSLVKADLNLTSMCLYSGLQPSSQRGGPPDPLYQGEFGYNYLRVENLYRGAWLGAGDAQLKDGARRARFFEHYGKLLDSVLTLALPHHGSEHNFDVSIIDRIKPDFCVAAADKFANWRHPGTGVIQAVASSGGFVATVTSSSISRVRESLRYLL